MSATKSKPRLPIHPSTRTCIMNVREYFAKEKENGGPLIPVKYVAKRTAEACKVGETSVRRISKEVPGIDGVLPTPGKKRKTPARVTELDDYQASAIRRKIYEYHKRNEFPNLNTILSSVKEAQLFKGEKSSLGIVLKNIGFSFERYNHKTVAMEKADVRYLKVRFLRAVARIDWSKVIFIDETYVYENHGYSKGCTDANGKKKGKGERLFICHAGGAQGFVPNALMMSTSEEIATKGMDAVKFNRWFVDSLLPNIAPNSIIFMDNAPHHSRVINEPPTAASSKKEILEWLRSHSVPTVGLLKAELLQLVQSVKPVVLYEINELARSAGHTVMRLPQYHSEYNAIESIYAQIKDNIAKNNAFEGLKAVEKLFLDSMALVTCEDWQRAIAFTKKTCEEDWETETSIDGVIDQFGATIDEEDMSDDD